MTTNDQLQNTTNNPNYVTPEESDAKACPMSMNSTEFASTCFGPKCMAWRWAESSGKIWIWAATDRDPEPRKNWVPIEEFEFNGRKAGKFRESPTHGYCGMVRT
jgi:hypothetical protein